MNHVRCPNCRRHLVAEQCAACGQRFVLTGGIPDLRWPPPSPPDAQEVALVAAVLKRYKDSTFDELSELVRRSQLRGFSEDLQEGLRSRSAGLDQLVEQMMDMF